MAAPSLIFFPPSELLTPVRDFAAEAELERVRAAATIARDRIARLTLRRDPTARSGARLPRRAPMAER